MRNNSANMGVLGGERTIIVGSPESGGGGGGGTLPVGGQFAEPQPQYADQLVYQLPVQPQLSTQKWNFSPSGVLALNYWNLYTVSDTSSLPVPTIDSCMETSTSGVWTKDFSQTSFLQGKDRHLWVRFADGNFNWYYNQNATYIWMLIRGVVYDANGNNASNVVDRTYQFIHYTYP
jgi:hypothetical protein